MDTIEFSAKALARLGLRDVVRSLEAMAKWKGESDWENRLVGLVLVTVGWKGLDTRRLFAFDSDGVVLCNLRVHKGLVLGEKGGWEERQDTCLDLVVVDTDGAQVVESVAVVSDNGRNVPFVQESLWVTKDRNVGRGGVKVDNPSNHARGNNGLAKSRVSDPNVDRVGIIVFAFSRRVLGSAKGAHRVGAGFVGEIDTDESHDLLVRKAVVTHGRLFCILQSALL